MFAGCLLAADDNESRDTSKNAGSKEVTQDTKTTTTAVRLNFPFSQ